jgi:serine/threonine-protein kinase
MTTVRQTFGRYELRGTLGEGGFATVYRAFDPALRREVALKALHPHLAANPEFRRRFLAEIQASAALRHPNIVTVYDVGEADGRPFFTMELIDGPTLADLISPGQGGLPPPRVAAIVRHLGAALDYLHGRGLVHRDIKPANIMLERGGRTVLMDFGIARILTQTQHTRTGAILGTPEAMAPEQIRGEAVGPPADIYALGVLTYQLLAGRPPFSGDLARLVYLHAHQPPPPLREARPGLPKPVYAAVDATLAKDPGRRPARAGQFAAVLAAAFPTPPAVGRQTTPSAPPAGPQRPPASSPPTEQLGGAAPAAAQRSPIPSTPPPAAAGASPARPARTPSRGAPVAAEGLAPRRRGHRVLPVAGLAAAAVVVLAVIVAGIVRSGGGAQSNAARALLSPAATSNELAQPPITPPPPPTPTPAPTAAPATITKLESFAGGDLLGGLPPRAELPVGGEVVVCYGYEGAGRGTALVVGATGPDGAPDVIRVGTPFAPDTGTGVRCEPLPGAADLIPGSYTLLVTDRGDERARGEVGILPPPPPPPPPPTQTPAPATPAPTVAVPRAPVATPAPAAPRPVVTQPPAPAIVPAPPAPPLAPPTMVPVAPAPVQQRTPPPVITVMPVAPQRTPPPVTMP